MSIEEPTSQRAEVVRELTTIIEHRRQGHPVRVAVDGPDAAGKTVLADEIAGVLGRQGRTVVRASVDGFHRTREERYRRGHDSARGYFEDSFDYAALRRVLLDPLGPDGNRRYRSRVFDYGSDTPLIEPVLAAPADAVLVFDGIFLLREELYDAWDLTIFVSASFEETLRRAVVRDADLFGSPDEVERRYRARYIPGQKLYFSAARPVERADVVVVNDDPRRPVLRIG